MSKFEGNAIEWLLSSFDTVTRGGASARKITAFTIVACVVVGHFLFYRSAHFGMSFIELLLVDYAFIAALFGMTTFERTKPSHGNSNPPANSEQASRDHQSAGN